MYKKSKIGLILFLFILLSTNISLAVSMTETFIPDAIDATTRWGTPIYYNGAPSWHKINSKWCEVRTIGTSPHVGIDTPVGKSYTVVAVVAGNLKRDTNDSTYNTTSLSTSKANVYCHYEHMLVKDIKPNGYYRAGDPIGIPGDAGAALHLHWGAYTTETLSGRKSYRNETLYRNASNWDNGRHIDVFSQVQWLGSGQAQVTISFSGANDDHTEKPKEVRMFYRVANTTNWIDGGTMTNPSGYNYQYNFRNVLSAGTSVEWTVRITRDRTIQSGNIIFAPAKFYNPYANPNATTIKYPFYTNVV